MYSMIIWHSGADPPMKCSWVWFASGLEAAFMFCSGFGPAFKSFQAQPPVNAASNLCAVNDMLTLVYKYMIFAAAVTLSFAAVGCSGIKIRGIVRSFVGKIKCRHFFTHFTKGRMNLPKQMFFRKIILRIFPEFMTEVPFIMAKICNVNFWIENDP